MALLVNSDHCPRQTILSEFHNTISLTEAHDFESCCNFCAYDISLTDEQTNKQKTIQIIVGNNSALKKATPKKNKDSWRINEKEEFVNLLYLVLEEDDNFQFISLSLSEIVNKCQLQGMMKSYGPHALLNLTQNQNDIKMISERLASGGFQPHDQVMCFLYDYIHVAEGEVLRSRDALQSQTLEVIDNDSEDDDDNPQKDEIRRIRRAFVSF